MNEDNYYDGSLDLRVTFTISDETELNSTLNFIEDYTSNPYNLKLRNCGHFVTHVLDQIDVTVPSGWENVLWYSYEYSNTLYNQTGPSVGALGEILNGMSHSKIENKQTSGVQTSPNTGCN